MTDPLAGVFFPLDEVAALLGVDQSRIERWAEMGALPVMGSPHGPRVRRDDLEIVAGPWLGPLVLADRLGRGSDPSAAAFDPTDVLRAHIRSQMFTEHSCRQPLFHYTHADTALDCILAEGRLRLGPPAGLNDPFESEPISVTVVLDTGDDGNPRGEIFQNASDYLRSCLRLSCLTLSGPQDYGPVGFGDGFARARMWAQYAGNHSGVCLAFDQGRLRTAAENAARRRSLRLYEQAIRYRDDGGLQRPVQLPLTRAERDLAGLLDDLFPAIVPHLYFNKAWDWSTETEYRFLLHGEVNYFEYIDVRSALTGVVCGPGFPEARWKNVFARCPELTEAQRVFKLTWRNGIPSTTPMTGASMGAAPAWDTPPAPSDTIAE